MNPEDFSTTVSECENEKPFPKGGHWDELSMKNPSRGEDGWDG